MSYVEFTNGSIVKELALNTPRGLHLFEASVAIDCDSAEVYVAGQGAGKQVQYFRSQALGPDHSGADNSWEKVGQPIRIPEQGIIRSIVHKGQDMLM